jgi:CHAT domain-containing protein
MLLQKEVDGTVEIDKLTLSAVSTAAAQGQLGWIAFLSACSTAEVKASQFADEGLHLASAFQITGFAHAIGALWPATDDVCTRLAEEFYTELAKGDNEKGITDRTVAVALRHAVMQVRAKSNNSPFQWAPFIHFGP